jgi:amino acid permease
MTAAEVENPRKALAKAVRRVFYRILMFYVLGILIVGASLFWLFRVVTQMRTGSQACSSRQTTPACCSPPARRPPRRLSSL